MLARQNRRAKPEGARDHENAREKKGQRVESRKRETELNTASNEWRLPIKGDRHFQLEDAAQARQDLRCADGYAQPRKGSVIELSGKTGGAAAVHSSGQSSRTGPGRTYRNRDVRDAGISPHALISSHAQKRIVLRLPGAGRDLG